MWTHDRLKPKNWKGQPVKFYQIKFNGHRYTFFKQHDNTLLAFGREIRPDLELGSAYPHVKDTRWWRCIQDNLPPHSSLDGELYLPNGKASDVKHCIVSDPNSLQFAAFALPVCRGVSYANAPCDAITNRISNELFYHGCRHGVITVVSSVFNPEIHTEQVLLEMAIANRIEGYVLKQSNYDGWYKVKPTKDIDCIVTGFEDGQGKYTGLVGSLKVSAVIDGEMRELANVSGMDDKTRIEIDEETDMNRVCEICYQDVGSKGRLIHARFIRWRDDKPRVDCSYRSEDL
jgi:hypothetical protein